MSFACQNVRSLNISTKNDITHEKILTVTRNKHDFVFLSDLRLNSNKQKSAVHDVEKTFFSQGYRIYHNSKHPSRGVGILIHKNIWEKGLRILGIDGDEEGNFLVIKAETTQGVFTLGSVYGPNHDEQANMYIRYSLKVN